MFAVIKSGGKQYKVSVGETLEVDRLHVEDGTQITFDEVLLISDENTTMIGAPYVENAQVLATAVKQKRGKKIIVFKYKSKKRYRHRRGHRQELTVLSIDDIIADGKSLITGKALGVEEAPAEEEVVPPATIESEAQAETPAGTEPEAEAAAESETRTQKRTRRRRRTARAEDTEEDTESKAEEE